MATSDDKATNNESSSQPHNENMLDDAFSLETQKAPLSVTLPKKESPRKSSPGNPNKGQAPEVLSYRYDDKRTNNPHVGMVGTYIAEACGYRTLWQSIDKLATISIK